MPSLQMTQTNGQIETRERQTIDISNRAVRLGRIIDRLAPGVHIVVLEISDDRQWIARITSGEARIITLR